MDRNNYLRPKNLLLDAIFPKQCVCCNEIIDSEEELCDDCIRNIERVDAAKRCKKCGLQKDSCQCRIYAYHFEGCVAPFFNDGIARRGFYAFKFKRRAHYGVYFADEMAKSVKSELGNIRFDYVCYVPASAYSFIKRGFNQSYILAKNLSNLLGIPLVKNSLIEKIGFRTQHSLNRKQRFEATHRKYKYNSKTSAQLYNKTVLLVDDIKTTGATLDECSRQLLFSGAKQVYCVTALITDMHNNKAVKKRVYKLKNLEKFGENIG